MKIKGHITREWGADGNPGEVLHGDIEEGKKVRCK